MSFCVGFCDYVVEPVADYFAEDGCYDGREVEEAYNVNKSQVSVIEVRALELKFSNL